MANEIGWGAAFSEENGYGMAAINGAESGYGNILMTSYSGETNISSQDADNIEIPREPMILADGPLIYVDIIDKDSMMFLSFILADGVEPMDMVAELFYNGESYTALPVVSGINDLVFSPASGEYYLNLMITLDGEIYTFQSNILTI